MKNEASTWVVPRSPRVRLRVHRASNVADARRVVGALIAAHAKDVADALALADGHCYPILYRHRYSTGHVSQITLCLWLGLWQIQATILDDQLWGECSPGGGEKGGFST